LNVIDEALFVKSIKIVQIKYNAIESPAIPNDVTAT